MPEQPITRGEFALVLRNLAKAVGKEVSEDHLVWAQETGILQGYETGLLPNRVMTRQEMAVLLLRFWQYMELSLQEGVGEKAYEEFFDAAQISSWAKAGAEFCTRVGLIQGNSRFGCAYEKATNICACGIYNCFEPQLLVTRAQAFQAIYNYVCLAKIELEPVNDLPLP